MDEGKVFWIIEDDTQLLDYYQELFGEKYHLVFFKSNSEFVSHWGTSGECPSLIMADLNLKDGSFLNHLDYLKNDKTRKFIAPVMIISANDDLEVLRYCYEQGVSEYLLKPIRKNELVVKVEKIIGKGPENITRSFLDNLTYKQRQILALFLESDNKIVSREKIKSEIWGDTSVHPKAIDVHLYNLRRRISEKGFIIRSISPGKWKLMNQLSQPEILF